MLHTIWHIYVIYCVIATTSLWCLKGILKLLGR